MTSFSNEQYQAALECGLSARDFMALHKVTHNAVRMRARKLELPMLAMGEQTLSAPEVPVLKGEGRQTKLDVARVLALRAGGLSYSRIAKAMGCCQGSVQRVFAAIARGKSLESAEPAQIVATPCVKVDTTGMDPIDAAVVCEGATWAGRATIAKRFAVPHAVVLARFHRLRVQG